MHFNIVSNLGVNVKDSGFSIDELVVRMQELFSRKAFPELLREILKSSGTDPLKVMYIFHF